MIPTRYRLSNRLSHSSMINLLSEYPKSLSRALPHLSSHCYKYLSICMVWSNGFGNENMNLMLWLDLYGKKKHKAYLWGWRPPQILLQSESICSYQAVFITFPFHFSDTVFSFSYLSSFIPGSCSQTCTTFSLLQISFILHAPYSANTWWSYYGLTNYMAPAVPPLCVRSWRQMHR